MYCLCGHFPDENIQSYKVDPSVNKVIFKDEKTEEMLQLDDEWKREML